VIPLPSTIANIAMAWKLDIAPSSIREGSPLLAKRIGAIAVAYENWAMDYTVSFGVRSGQRRNSLG
jgi:hypothetical protein